MTPRPLHCQHLLHHNELTFSTTVLKHSGVTQHKTVKCRTNGKIRSIISSQQLRVQTSGIQNCFLYSSLQLCTAHGPKQTSAGASTSALSVLLSDNHWQKLWNHQFRKMFIQLFYFWKHKKLNKKSRDKNSVITKGKNKSYFSPLDFFWLFFKSEYWHFNWLNFSGMSIIFFFLKKIKQLNKHPPGVRIPCTWTNTCMFRVVLTYTTAPLDLNINFYLFIFNQSLKKVCRTTVQLDKFHFSSWLWLCGGLLVHVLIVCEKKGGKRIFLATLSLWIVEQPYYLPCWCIMVVEFNGAVKFTYLRWLEPTR